MKQMKKIYVFLKNAVKVERSMWGKERKWNVLWILYILNGWLHGCWDRCVAERSASRRGSKMGAGRAADKVPVPRMIYTAVHRATTWIKDCSRSTHRGTETEWQRQCVQKFDDLRSKKVYYMWYLYLCLDWKNNQYKIQDFLIWLLNLAWFTVADFSNKWVLLCDATKFTVWPFWL